MFHLPFLDLLSLFSRCLPMLTKFFRSMSCSILLIREKCCLCSAQMFLEEAQSSEGVNTSHFSSGQIPTRSPEVHILFDFGPKSKLFIILECCTTRQEFFNINTLICLRCTPPHASKMLPKLLMLCMLTRCFLSIVATIPSLSSNSMQRSMSLVILRTRRHGNLIT